MKEIKLTKDIVLDDLAIYIKSLKAIVFTDLHLGYEESLHSSGFLIPKFHFKDIKDRLKYLFNKYNPKKIIILGDIQHEFKFPKFSVRKQISELLKLCSDQGELFLLKGNHEKTLIYDKLQSYKLYIHLKLGNYFFCHGDKLYDKNNDFKKSKIIIIGHQHPSITLHDSTRQEHYKIFIKSKYFGKDLFVLPSFNLLTIGVDILLDNIISPYLKESINKSQIFIIGTEIYDFGNYTKLKEKFN